MGTWVLWGVLRSQWANPLYIPLTQPDITIHFCHSTNIIIINHSISENCRKSHILLSVENSFTQKLLELHADWLSVLKVQIYLILREKYNFLFYQVWEASILGVMIFVWIHRKYKAGSRQREVWSQLISSSHIYLIRCWLHWINHSYRNWNL